MNEWTLNHMKHSKVEFNLCIYLNCYIISFNCCVVGLGATHRTHYGTDLDLVLHFDNAISVGSHITNAHDFKCHNAMQKANGDCIPAQNLVGVFFKVVTSCVLAKKFLKDGNQVRVSRQLRGRQQKFGDLAKEKIGSFLKILEEEVSLRIIQELKKKRGGLSMVIIKR